MNFLDLTLNQLTLKTLNFWTTWLLDHLIYEPLDFWTTLFMNHLTFKPFDFWTAWLAWLKNHFIYEPIWVKNIFLKLDRWQSAFTSPLHLLLYSLTLKQTSTNDFFLAPIIQNDRNGEVKEEHPLVHVLIDDLMSGVEYNFQIQVISYGLISDLASLQVRTMPLIQSEIFIVSGLDPNVKNSVTLTYTQTPQNQKIKFDHYRFSIGDPDIAEKEKLANDTNRKVTFSDLMPGRLYNIKMWTVSGGVASQPIQRQDRLHPQPITTLNATKVTDTEISLSWDKPEGEYTSFEVQYLVDNNYASNITNDLHITINDLKPHRNYTFTVVVRSGTELSVLRNSVPVSAVFTTEEAVPGRVHKFNPIDVQPSEIVFEWSLPVAEQNGVITQFSIIYIPENGSQSTVKNFNPENLRGTIRSLTPGMTYIFKIQAKTSIGYGPEKIWKQKMPILAPPKPGNQVVPTEVHRSSNTIQIRFRKNYFLDSNGVVTMYTIIVAEDDSKNSSGLEMPSWHDVQSYSIWPPYQAFDPYYPFKNSSVNVEDFIIGAENCDNRQKGYCNGPLKSGTTYRVKIRAFTAPDKFTDTAYSFPIQTGKFPITFESDISWHNFLKSFQKCTQKLSEGIRIVKGKLKSLSLVLSLLYFYVFVDVFP